MIGHLLKCNTEFRKRYICDYIIKQNNDFFQVKVILEYINIEGRLPKNEYDFYTDIFEELI